MTKFYGVLFDHDAAEDDVLPDEWSLWYCQEANSIEEVNKISGKSPCKMYHDVTGHDEDPFYFVLKVSLHDTLDERGAPKLPKNADEILRRECLRAKVPWKQPEWYCSKGRLYGC